MSLTNKGVRLAVIPNISADLRHWRRAHKFKRARECAKVEPATPLEPIPVDLAADIGWDEPEVYDQYTADPRGEFADSVGMSLHERMR